MTQLKPESRIVATIMLDTRPGERPAEVRPGQHESTNFAIACHVSEGMLMDINAMMRARWEKAAREMNLTRRKDEYPRNIDVSF